MNSFPRTAVFIVMHLLTFILLPDARAEPPKLSLEISPSTVQLAAGEEIDALVIVRNTTTKSLEKLRLFSLAASHATVSIRKPDVKSLQADGSHAWTVRIAKSSTDPSASDVCFRFDYSWKSKSSTELVPGTAVGILKVQDRPLESVDTIADIKTETALERLEDGRFGILYLTVRNTSSFPLVVKSIVSPREPDYVSPEKLDLGDGVRLSARETKAFPIGVQAKDAVQAGQQLLVFEIGLNWERMGQTYSGSLIATHELTMGVMGESDILKALGVPVFFLLPGFLMVSGVAFLAKYFIPKRSIPIEAKSTEFWLLAITCSLITAPLYPWITGLRGERRNYLTAYGMRDIAYVWAGSLVAAFLLWLVGTSAMHLAARIRKVRKERIVPSRTDTPLDVLEKLARNEMSLYPIQVDLQADGGSETKRYFVVEPMTEDQTEVWVAPPILFKWTAQTSEAFQRCFREESEPNKENGAARMAELIKREARTNEEGKSLIELRWRDGEHPFKVDVNKLEARNELGKACILAEETDE